MIKPVLITAIFAFTVAAVTWTSVNYGRDPDISRPHVLTPAQVQTNQYVRICSGLDLTSEQARLLATASCLGRLRGYTDSHQQTVRMLQQTYAISHTSQLWCVPKTITDKQLLTLVLDWADANPLEYESVVTTYSGTAGAMGVLAAALHATYPCANP